MPSVPSPTALAVLARTVWMFVGPAALLLLAYSLAAKGADWLSGGSIAFLVLLAVVIAARWGDPLDSDGQPVDRADLQKYSLTALATGLGIWVAAHLIGFYWLAE